MASTSFRDSMNSLGWSRRDQDVPVNTAQQSGLMSSIKSLNPFQNNSYIQLPTTEGAGAPLPAANRREEEEGFATRESSRFVQLPTHQLEELKELRPQPQSYRLPCSWSNF
ncbi:hypothetical protein ColLi_09733 [Colletotrichum liriopes]|uniref:Uncharacterized protein n=1 Tax=Colletotrichum liriopes TaxID=708192 RepID=A0AA37GUA2_9PEZI|nr:hypothetical protein ColLi_09733 [Colletotrichum liriopes]